MQESDPNIINTTSNQSLIGSSLMENPQLLNEKQSDEPSIENIKDDNQKGKSFNKDGYIGK
jgi:hypothetical protein